MIFGFSCSWKKGVHVSDKVVASDAVAAALPQVLSYGMPDIYVGRFAIVGDYLMLRGRSAPFASESH